MERDSASFFSTLRLVGQSATTTTITTTTTRPTTIITTTLLELCSVSYQFSTHSSFLLEVIAYKDIYCRIELSTQRDKPYASRLFHFSCWLISLDIHTVGLHNYSHILDSVIYTTSILLLCFLYHFPFTIVVCFCLHVSSRFAGRVCIEQRTTSTEH